MNVDSSLVWQARLPLLSLIVLSVAALYFRYREGRLLTPASGLHLQIFIFFGLGGLAFVSFLDAEPILNNDEVFHYAAVSSRPLLVGYAIAVAVEYFLFKTPKRPEPVLTKTCILPSGILLALAIMGFSGHLLEGRVSLGSFNSVPTYFKSLFFPCLLLALINTVMHKVTGRIITPLIFLMAILTGVLSPWRSVLIILAATFMLGISLSRPKSAPLALGAGIMLLLFLIPFQNIRKSDPEAFGQHPVEAFKQVMNMSLRERSTDSGEFLAKRLNYLREAAYIYRATEADLTLLHGKTYEAVLAQLVPRFIWPEKPELARLAGYELPREVGLLQEVDENTSWAVNMFAEAMYNFGPTCLIWFIPVAFLVAHGIEALLPKWLNTERAHLVGNVAYFYFFLERTTVIFAASIGLAMMVVLKIVDLAMGWMPSNAPLAGRHAGDKRLGRRRVRQHSLRGSASHEDSSIR